MRTNVANQSDVVAILSAGRPNLKGNIKDRISPEEWQARVELAALYRIADHFRWTDTIYNHISMRVPGEFNFLINPFGLWYNEITASSLVKITVEGEVLDDPTGLGINLAGYVIHGAIHAARHDVTCVMHTHTRAGCGVAAQEHGLLPISQYAAFLEGHVAYHDFEGFAVNREEQARLVTDLGERYLMILRNHGLLTCGRNAGEMLAYMVNLERACEIQIAALSAGGAAVRHVTPDAIAASNGLFKKIDGDFSRDWTAMLRLVERIAPDYRE